MNLNHLYQQVILDHSKYKKGFTKNIKNKEKSLNNSKQVSTFFIIKYSHQVNPICGDEIKTKIYLLKNEEGISKIQWNGNGCAISLASASILSELINNITIKKFKHMFNTFKYMLGMFNVRQIQVNRKHFDDSFKILGDAIVFSGVKYFKARIKCAILPWISVNEAIKNHT